MKHTRLLLCAVCAVGLLAGPLSAQEQYPKPLVHTPADHPAARVLLLNVEGLHAFDLPNWIAAHPRSSLAELTSRGVTYTNAYTPVADPVAGLVSLATGGTPISTGILASRGFDHALYAPGADCKRLGAPFLLDGGFSSATAPQASRGECRPVMPHDLLRVNTIFEVVHTKIGPTAWAGANAAATDLLRGPSGAGLDEACTLSTDAARTAAVVGWLNGRGCLDAHRIAVPALFGMTFMAFAERQQERGAYADVAGTPSPALWRSLAGIDQQIGTMVGELKAKGLFDSTWIVITASYAGRLSLPSRLVPAAQLRAAAESGKTGVVALMTAGDSAFIWLNDRAETSTVVAALAKQADALGIADILEEHRLALTLNMPSSDSRMPDIVLIPSAHVRWTEQAQRQGPTNGGFSEDARHVALLISGAQLTGRFDPTLVPTTQLAPLLLRSLGMEKFDLDALHKEHSPALPGIF